MKRSGAWAVAVASAAASIPLVVFAGGSDAAQQAPQPTLLAAGGGGGAAEAAPAWLPKGCRLIEIGPASAGYKACASPKGFRPPSGYMLADTAQPPKVHAKTGASGA